MPRGSGARHSGGACCCGSPKETWRTRYVRLRLQAATVAWVKPHRISRPSSWLLRSRLTLWQCCLYLMGSGLESRISVKKKEENLKKKVGNINSIKRCNYWSLNVSSWNRWNFNFQAQWLVVAVRLLEVMLELMVLVELVLVKVIPGFLPPNLRL